MQSSIAINSVIALFTAMLVLAFVPGLSVLVVSARSAASGFIHGVFATLGIVTGDIVYIVLAIYGLTVMVDLMGNYFVLVKYLGGAYLIWLGVVLWRKKSENPIIEGNTEASLLSSYMTGLLVTLSDQKAILFYLGFFPAFVDLSTLTYVDTGIIILIAALAVGSAKLVYALMASRAGMLTNSSRARKGLDVAAASVMICVGFFLMTMA
jgi:threonine/homoserine/homoserine lactone efflux protein